MKAIETGQREHHWDAIRALLMLLGIPYHVALSYRSDHAWIVHSGEGAPVFIYVAEFIHFFRMPAFFFIAGYFAALLLARRTPTEWLRGRLVRLGVPFVACLVTLVPLLNLVCEASNLPLGEALASWRYNAVTSGGYWVRHLWFIIVLLQCNAAAALLVRRFPRLRTASMGPALDDWLARHFLLALVSVAVGIGLWEAGSIELFYKAGLATNLPQEILRLDELPEFAPFFLLGGILNRAPRTLERLYCFAPSITLVAVVSLATSLIFLDDIPPPLARFVSAIAAVSTTQLIIAVTRLTAIHPYRLIERLVPASFVIYLFHMPIILVLVSIGQHVTLPLSIKAALVMLLALVLSYGAWRIIDRSPLLSFLFNGTKLPGRKPARQRLVLISQA